jgi:Flp pilus assembly pilin Flp
MKDKALRRRRRRGAVQVEYAFLLVFVMCPTAFALLAGGRQMYGMYKTSRAAILNSSP